MIIRTLLSRAACATGALAICAGMAMADDGRTGPAVFTGDILDHKLASMNDWLQDRYRQEDMLAHLDETPAADFVTVAAAVSETPLDPPRLAGGAFGPPVFDGRTLNLHLAAFNADLQGRGDDLFLRIATAAAGRAPDFEAVARDHRRITPDFLGLVQDDPSLDRQMDLLAEGLRHFEIREERLYRAAPAVTQDSFDRYTSALRLY